MTRVLLSLALLVAPAAAQWASIPYDANEPVHTEGFCVVHQNGTGIHAFSAVTQRWDTLAGSGAELHGVGDFVALVEENGVFRAWSARRNDSSDLVEVVEPAETRVEDGLAIVVDRALAAPKIWAYSAETNEWRDLGLGVEPSSGDLASSRFVACVRSETTFWGFSARTGEWASVDIDKQGADPVADGNVAVVDFDPGFSPGERVVAAFSGVRGTWDVSPLYRVGSPLLVDHNVAYLEAEAGGDLFSACGFSAYNAKWVTSQEKHPTGGQGVDLADNWVRLSSGDPRFEAFGARPGGDWTPLVGNWMDLSSTASDYTMVIDGDGCEVLAFSGLAAATWSSYVVGGGATAVAGPDRMGFLRDGSDTWAAYSPATHTWATLAPGASGLDNVGDSTATVFPVGGTFEGYSTRWARWVAGPKPTSLGFSSAEGGAIVALRELFGSDQNRIHVYDERCESWTFLDPGYAPEMVAGGNVLLVYPTPSAGAQPVHAWSAQTGDWSGPSGVVHPLLELPAPVVEENVASFVDSGGNVFAFGSPNDGHVWHQWPNGGEYHVSGQSGAGVPPPTIGWTTRAEPGEHVFGLISPFNHPGGLAIPGVGGLLHLDVSTTFHLGLLGLTDPKGTVPARFPLTGALPAGVPVWWQPLIVSIPTLSARFPDRADASWLY